MYPLLSCGSVSGSGHQQNNAPTNDISMTTLFWSCLLLFASFTTANDRYDELLQLTPLFDGRILATFQFTVSTSYKDAQNNEYDLFPKSLAQILVATQVESLSLVLTKGAWDRNRFGGLEPFPVGPPGAELRATFLNKTTSTDTTTSSDDNWTHLKAALGGIFCASLSTIDTATTMAGTKYIYAKQYHGYLQREMLCTENLAPLIKLLPCRTKGGLATLLKATTVFEADFTSIGLTVTADREGLLTTSLTTALILDNANVLLSPAATNLQQQERQRQRQRQRQHCPHASSSFIQLNQPTWGTLAVINDATPSTNPSNNTNNKKQIASSRKPDQIKCNGACYMYDALIDMSLKVTHARLDDWQQFLAAPGLAVKHPLNIQRSLVGTGRVKGGLVTEIANIGKETIEIQYLDIIPWYLQIYTHTLVVTLNGETIAKGAWRVPPTEQTVEQEDPVIHVTPTYKEGPPSMIESTFILKQGDTFRVEIDYELVFLQFEQFPPDANRGFDIPSAIIQLRSPLSLNGKNSKHEHDHNWKTIYTSGLMIEMPYPDFSMPYNVVTLTSTLMAFIGGTILNMLSRKKREAIEDEDDKGGQDGKDEKGEKDKKNDKDGKDDTDSVVDGGTGILT
jgi:phosphatidylinositol glycan class T